MEFTDYSTTHNVTNNTGTCIDFTCTECKCCTLSTPSTFQYMFTTHMYVLKRNVYL